jgi:hypothetical protein
MANVRARKLTSAGSGSGELSSFCYTTVKIGKERRSGARIKFLSGKRERSKQAEA